MTDIITIESDQSLPTVEELLKLLQIHETVTFNYSTLTEEYISALTYSLPSHFVYNSEWDKTIIISPSIKNERILQKKLQLFECAQAFREDGNRLMHLMSTTFGVEYLIC